MAKPTFSDETKGTAPKVETKPKAVPVIKKVVKEPVLETTTDPYKDRTQEQKEAFMTKQIHDHVDYADRINWDIHGHLIADDEYKLYDVVEEGRVLKTEMQERRTEKRAYLQEAMDWKAAEKAKEKKIEPKEYNPNEFQD